MKKTYNAQINITNRQTDGTDSDVIKTQYSGRFYENNGKYYLMYKENENVSCMIKVDGCTVTVNRSGEASSVMVCERGKECSFLYKMPYGAMQMCIKTDDVNISLNNSGGDIRLLYGLYVNGGCITNDMNINITVTA